MSEHNGWSPQCESTEEKTLVWKLEHGSFVLERYGRSSSTTYDIPEFTSSSLVWKCCRHRINARFWTTAIFSGFRRAIDNRQQADHPLGSYRNLLPGGTDAQVGEVHLQIRQSVQIHDCPGFYCW